MIRRTVQEQTNTSQSTPDHHIAITKTTEKLLNQETLALVQHVLPHKGHAILGHLLGYAALNRDTTKQDSLLIDTNNEVILKIRSVADLAKKPGSPCAPESYHKLLLVLEALEIISRRFHRTWTEIRIPLGKREFSQSKILAALERLEQDYRNKKVKQIAKKAARRVRTCEFLTSWPTPVAPYHKSVDEQEAITRLLLTLLHEHGIESPIASILQQTCESIAVLLQPAKGERTQKSEFFKRLPVTTQSSTIASSSECKVAGQQDALPLNKPETKKRYDSEIKKSEFQASPTWPRHGQGQPTPVSCDFSGDASRACIRSEALESEGDSHMSVGDKKRNTPVSPGDFQRKDSPFSANSSMKNSQKIPKGEFLTDEGRIESPEIFPMRRVSDPKSASLPETLPATGEEASSIENFDLENLNNVNVNTIINNNLNNVNVKSYRMLAKILGTILGEEPSKWGIYAKHFQQYHQPKAIIAALIETLKCQWCDGSLQNPPAFFLARSKKYHDGIPDDIQQLVKRYETIPYGELVESLKRPFPSSSEIAAIQTSNRKPGDITSSALQAIKPPPLHIQLETEKVCMTWEEAVSLYKMLCQDTRMTLCKKFLVPVGDEQKQYALLLDATISSKVRQVFLYTSQEWLERSKNMRTCLSLFESPESLQRARNRFTALRELLKKN